jgi:hypothetical protein
LGGERVCVAHYMKDFVHEHLGVPRSALPKSVVSYWKIGLEAFLKMVHIIKRTEEERSKKEIAYAIIIASNSRQLCLCLEV